MIQGVIAMDTIILHVCCPVCAGWVLTSRPNTATTGKPVESCQKQGDGAEGQNDMLKAVILQDGNPRWVAKKTLYGRHGLCLGQYDPTSQSEPPCLKVFPFPARKTVPNQTYFLYITQVCETWCFDPERGMRTWPFIEVEGRQASVGGVQAA